MSFDPADNDLIEKYLLGKLDDREIAAFNYRLGEDREFARKFRLIKTFPEMMSEAGRIEFEKKLSQAVERVMDVKTNRSGKKLLLIWGSVSVIGVAGIILLIFFLSKNRTEQPSAREQHPVPEGTAVKTIPAKARKDTIATAVQSSSQPGEKEMIKGTAIADQKKAGPASPDGGTKFSRKEMILFQWTQKSDTFTRLYIYTETGDNLMLWRGIMPGIQEYKIPGSYLMPGKFYWCVGKKENRHSFVVIE
jgi:hypothetical protein